MRLSLAPHPDTPAGAVERIDVEVSNPSGRQLRLRYTVTGRIGDILLPAAADPERTDDLWRHTCFEAFVRQPGSEAYAEFNLSPSTQWAAYRFDTYRSGMRNADVPAPQIEGRGGDGHYELLVAFDLPGPAPWRLALSAVIEEKGGRKSFWALAHAPGKPDFHHADSFAMQLPAAERS